jgi:hypothetical protein
VTKSLLSVVLWFVLAVLAFTVGREVAPLITRSFAAPSPTSVATAARSRATLPPTPTPRPTPDAARLRVLVTSVGADALAEQLREQLPQAWREATGGRGRLEVVTLPTRSGGSSTVDESSSEWDLQLFVVGGAGISNHVGRQVGSRAVVFEHDPSTVQGHQGAEVARVAVALHELGHIWCCYGPGTFEGHWITETPAPGLMNQYWFIDDGGNPRFGLVFSERELDAMHLAR